MLHCLYSSNRSSRTIGGSIGGSISGSISRSISRSCSGITEVSTQDWGGVRDNEVLGGVLVHVRVPVSHRSRTLSVPSTHTLLEEADMLNHLVLHLQPLAQLVHPSLAFLAGHIPHCCLAAGSQGGAHISGSSGNKFVQNSGEPVIDKLSDIARII